MENKLIRGIPRLRLCLIFSLLWLSCSVKQPALSATMAPDNGKIKWKLEVLLVSYTANSEVDRTDREDLLVQPFAVNNHKDLNGISVTSLSFHLKTIKEVSLLREQLLLTGRVKKLTITED